jgi:hypothetical protein
MQKQKLTITTLTQMFVATLLVTSLLSGIVTMLAGLQEYSLMALPADGRPAMQARNQPETRSAVDATSQDHGFALK